MWVCWPQRGPAAQSRYAGQPPRAHLKAKTSMPEPQLRPLITRVRGLLATEADGEAVLLHFKKAQYCGLARSAHLRWDLPEPLLTFEPLHTVLSKRYHGAPDAITAETRRFAEQLAAESLVTLE